MARGILFAGGLIAALVLGQQADANVIPFQFSGQGVSGSGTFTVVPNVSPPDPNPNCGTPGNNACRQDPPGAYRISGISGTFSDSNIGISNAAITGLVPTNPANERDPTFDPLVPASLSFVGSQTDPKAYFSYDNLFYPNGAPIVCSYPFTGTFLDPFGTAFTITGGATVDFWGDGNSGPGHSLTYGVGVLNDGRPFMKLDNQFSGVSATVPEPGSLWLLATGLVLLSAFTIGSGTFRRRRSVID